MYLRYTCTSLLVTSPTRKEANKQTSKQLKQSKANKQSKQITLYYTTLPPKSCPAPAPAPAPALFQ